MDPNTTPPQTPSTDAMPPAEQPPTPAQMPTVGGAPSKSKMPMIIGLVVVLLLAAGGAAYYFLVQKKNPPQTSANTQNTSTNKTTETPAADMMVSSISNDDKDYGSGTISVTHPKDWKVQTGKDQYGANQLVITSAAGTTLNIAQQINGVGGTCEPDTMTYTLVKKIPTKSPLYAFTEYSTTDPSWGPETLGIEPFANASAAHKALTEGQSNTDLCDNIGKYYPIVDGMFVRIEGVDGKQLTYDTIKTDTQFITMLGTFTATDK